MKISTNSWHYRMVNCIGDGHLDCRRMSLCSYFWRVVWCCVLAPIFLSCMVAVMAILALFTASAWVCEKVRPYWWALHDCWRERHPRKPVIYNTAVEAKQPNLFVAWWRAKKAKVCPLIEWYDPSKEKSRGKEERADDQAPPGTEGAGSAEDVRSAGMSTDKHAH